MLSSPVGLHCLVEFLLREFCVETILFWHAVTALERARPPLPDDAAKDAAAVSERRRLSGGAAATQLRAHSSNFNPKLTRHERRARLSEPLEAVSRVCQLYVFEGAVHEVGRSRPRAARQLPMVVQTRAFQTRRPRPRSASHGLAAFDSVVPRRARTRS